MTWNPLDPNHAAAPLVALLLIVGQLCTAWLAKPIAEDLWINPAECEQLCRGNPKEYARDKCICFDLVCPKP